MQTRRLTRITTRNPVAEAEVPEVTSPPLKRKERKARTPVPSSDSSVASSGVVEPGLDKHLRTQLCEDIEANGGIGEFIGTKNSLCSLLNQIIEDDPLKKSLYKQEGHPLRRQLQQQVYRWQKYWNSDQYEKKVLADLGVVAASSRAKEIPKEKRKAVNTQVQYPAEEDEHLLIASPHSPAPPIPVAPPVKEYRSEPTRSKNTESDLVKAFSRMTVDEQIYFVTPTSALGAFPPVDGRTCKCLPCLVFTLPIFAPS